MKFSLSARDAFPLHEASFWEEKNFQGGQQNPFFASGGRFAVTSKLKGMAIAWKRRTRMYSVLRTPYLQTHIAGC
jgi:hypothetical protein